MKVLPQLIGRMKLRRLRGSWEGSGFPVAQAWRLCMSSRFRMWRLAFRDNSSCWPTGAKRQRLARGG